MNACRVRRQPMATLTLPVGCLVPNEAYMHGGTAHELFDPGCRSTKSVHIEGGAASPGFLRPPADTPQAALRQLVLAPGRRLRSALCCVCPWPVPYEQLVTLVSAARALRAGVSAALASCTSCLQSHTNTASSASADKLHMHVAWRQTLKWCQVSTEIPS